MRPADTIEALAAASLTVALALGGACASTNEVTATRQAEEQWERVPVVPTASAEAVRFDPGDSSITPAVRADLDRLAARLVGESAGCGVDLQRLARDRAAVVRQYLSRHKGIDRRRFSTRGGCVLVVALPE